MTGDPNTEAYNALHPVRYGFVESLTFRQDLDNWRTGFTISIRLAARPFDNAAFLILEFEGAQELKVGDFQGSYILIEIRCIKDDQLENLNYQIVENEQNALSFKCKNFTARVGT